MTLTTLCTQLILRRLPEKHRTVKYIKFTDHQQALDALEQRINALAVTCSFYREAISKARRLINVGEMGDADDVLAKAERNLPNADAALAAIEARGVEKALAIVEECRGSVCAGGLSENRQYEESIVHPHLDGIADELESLAIELREAK